MRTPLHNIYIYRERDTERERETHTHTHSLRRAHTHIHFVLGLNGALTMAQINSQSSGALAAARLEASPVMEAAAAAKQVLESESLGRFRGFTTASWRLWAYAASVNYWSSSFVPPGATRAQGPLELRRP